MFEARGFKRILNDFRHPNNTLFKAASLGRVLLARRIPQKRYFAIVVWYILWLGGFDLRINELFEGRFGALGSTLDFFVRWPFHRAVFLVEIGSLNERN